MGSAMPPSDLPGAGKFREFEELLARDLVEKLDNEHQREVDALYQEQFALREELSRIVTLMQNEVLPREKMMHELMEGMFAAHEKATTTLHQNLAAHMEASKGKMDQINSTRAQQVDPMKAMEQELVRIQEVLGHNIARPDIAGWQGGGGNLPPRGGGMGSARMQPPPFMGGVRR